MTALQFVSREEITTVKFRDCTQLQLWNNRTLIFYACRCIDFKQRAWISHCVSKYRCCMRYETQSILRAKALHCQYQICWYLCVHVSVHVLYVNACDLWRCAFLCAYWTHACSRVDSRVSLGAGNYCTVVKHHYSLICPLAPSVRLRTTSYTISTIPRTAPPTHTPSIHLLKLWLTGQHSSPHLFLHLSLITLYFFHTPSFFQLCVMLAGSH